VFAAIPDAKVSCRYERGFYLCRPADNTTRAAFIALQKAIDGLINVLPLFKPIEPSPGTNPIGSSKAGYDGVVGPTTSGLGLTALIGALQVMKEAGVEDASHAAILAKAVTEIQEAPRTKNFSGYAPEITEYLVTVTRSFGDLLAKIQEKRAEGERSLFVEPPEATVIHLPADVAGKYGNVVAKQASIGIFAALALGLGYVLWRGMRGPESFDAAKLVR
jgi:hypothetical protein